MMISNQNTFTRLLFCTAVPWFSDACSSGAGTASSRGPAPLVVAEECGPQAPRDISVPGGSNPMAVPGGETPNLCNVHFHEPFEHAGFVDLPQVSGEPGEPVCHGIANGDRVEFHWVYTSCALPDEPKPGLANCVCDRPDMVLRVHAEAYIVDDDGGGVVQTTTGLATYGGSTTGPDYNNQTCSRFRVNWLVNPRVSRLARAALGAWCDDNPWHEDHAHAAREPVTAPEWLSPYVPGESQDH